MTVLPKTADVVIIGAGAIGACTAYYLAKRGITNVVVLEQRSYLGGVSTSKCAGGIRNQFSTEINVELSKLSLKLLNQLDIRSSIQQAVDWCGYMFLLTKQDDVAPFQEAIKLQHQLGIHTEWLDQTAVKKKLPMLMLEDIVGATFYQGDGLIDPNTVVSSYTNLSRELGVQYFIDTTVTNILTDGYKVQQVFTSQGVISTNIVVNATGPWSKFVAEMAGIHIPVAPVHQQLLVTEEIPWIPADFPVVVFPGEGLGFHKEAGGLLTGLNKSFEQKSFVDLESDQTDLDWELEHLMAAVHRMPGLEEISIKSKWGGLYDMTPDSHPILGKNDALEGFYNASGFSGHGFMHSQATGLLLSEEIIDGVSQTLDISKLRLNRFSTPVNKNLREYYKI